MEISCASSAFLPEVATAIVYDVANNIEKISILSESNSKTVDIHPGEKDVPESRKPILSLNDLYSTFRPLETLAFEMSIPDASMHIRRALQLMGDDVRKKNAKPYRQLLISEVFESSGRQ